MEKSDNPLLSEIQDLIWKKYDLESWPSDMSWISKQKTDGDWIDVHVFGEESYVFTVGVVGDKIIVYRPGFDTFARDNVMSLFNEGFLEELWDSIDAVISKITHI